MLVACEHLVRLPPNIGVGITTELVHRFHDLVLEAIWTAVADDVQHPLTNSHILIANHLEHPLPELVNVALNLARAELLYCLKSNVVVFVVGVLENHLHVIGFTAEPHDILLGGARRIQLLLLIVHALPTHSDYKCGAAAELIHNNKLFD